MTEKFLVYFFIYKSLFIADAKSFTYFVSLILLTLVIFNNKYCLNFSAYNNFPFFKTGKNLNYILDNI